MNYADDLTEEALRRALSPLDRGMTVRVLGVTGSTNDEAKRLFSHGTVPLPALLVADRQTGGKGRLGRSFHSPSGTGVYFSVALTADLPVARFTSVTCAAAVAVFRAVRDLCGIELSVKWVNDLLLDGKKVCGILTEAVSVGNATGLVVGIGINLRPADFPDNLKEIAGTLGDMTVARADLIGRIVSELLPYLADPDRRDWLDDYRERSCVVGKTVTCTRGNDVFCAYVKQILPDGSLSIQLDDGREDVLSGGEISLRL